MDGRERVSISDYGYDDRHAYIEAVAAEAPALSTRLQAFDGLCRLFQSGRAAPTEGRG